MPKYRIPSDYKNDTSRAQHRWPSGAASPIHAGLAYPVHHRHLDIGDRIRGSINTLIQSEAMEGPLLNGFRLVTIATFTPDGVVNGWLRSGKRYTPSQYRNFTRWYFDPSDVDPAVPYTDPAFQVNRYVIPLSKGISVAANSTPQQRYELWASDFRPGSDVTSLTHVGRGGLWDWLGVPAGAVFPRLQASGGTPPSFRWPIESFAAYFLSHYYYIANMQEEFVYFTRGVQNMANGEASVPAEVPFNIVFSSIDPNNALDFFNMLAYNSRSGVGIDVNNTEMTQYMRPVQGMLFAGLDAHGGLLSVPYSPDLFGNIIKQGSSPSVQIPVISADDGGTDTGYAVAVPDLRLWSKFQNWVDRLFVSGGRIGDVFRTLWGKDSSPYLDKPDFLGVWQTSINPSNVVATSNGTADGSSANVGQMAARIDSYSDYSKGGKIDYYAQEPGTFMLISMLVPQPAYFQGLHPDLLGTSFGDDFNPELTGMGFQAVPRCRFSMMPEDFDAALSTTGKNPWLYIPGTTTYASVDPNALSVGEEIAWAWLRTDYRRLHGEFAQNGNLQYWVLGRRFTDYYVSDINENTPTYGNYSYYGTYVNPLSWQYLFVSHTLMDPNFIYLGDFDLKVTSSLPANYMPFLGR